MPGGAKQNIANVCNGKKTKLLMGFIGHTYNWGL